MLAELKTEYDSMKYEVKNSFTLTHPIQNKCFRARLEISSAIP